MNLVNVTKFTVVGILALLGTALTVAAIKNAKEQDNDRL